MKKEHGLSEFKPCSFLRIFVQFSDYEDLWWEFRRKFFWNHCFSHT